MNISIKSDIDGLIRDMNHLARRQVPFAASQAINDVAKDANKAVKAQAEKKLDRPRPQTVKAFRMGKPALKSRLFRELFILDWAAEFLKYQIEGGVRRARGRGTGVPVNQRLNKYGNIPGRAKGLVKKKNQFIATINGIEGVWERRGRGGRQVKLITAFEQRVEYKPRLPYYKIIQGVVGNRFGKHFDKRLKAALASAR